MCGSRPVVSKALLARVMTEFPGQLDIHRTGGIVKTRSFIVTTGFSKTNNIGVYMHCVDAVVSALLERFFFIKVGGEYIVPIAPRRGIFRTESYATFRAEVLSHIPIGFPRLSHQSCVDRFSGLKRKRYEAALLSLRRDALSREDSRLKLFCKFAKNVIGEPARVISPRSARFNLELATYVKHLEHRIYSSIHRCFKSESRATVMKGLNVDDRADVLRAKWDRFIDPVAVMFDVSKLDASIGVPQLRYEHSFYTGVYPRAHKLKWMLRMMRKHDCVAYANDGIVKVQTAGRRASGDVTTSLGNVILVCSVIWTLQQELSIDIELANDGDDGVIVFERCHLGRVLARVVERFRDCGFILKVEKPRFEFEDIVFCQHVPMSISGRWRMVRQVRKVFAKDPLCLIGCPNERVYRKWLGAVGCAGSHLCDGVPVLQEFYACLKRNGRVPSNRFFNHLMRHTHFMKRSKVRDSTIDDSNRLSFYLATGIMPDHQVAIEEWLLTLQIGELRENVVCLDQLVGHRGAHLDLLTADSR